MELWLCPRSTLALIREDGQANVINIDDPFTPLYSLVDSRFSQDEQVEAFILKTRAVRATISGNEFFISKGRKSCTVRVRDFDTYYDVKVLTYVKGFDLCTFLAYVNGETAYLQFYVGKDGAAHCRARSAHTSATEPFTQIPGYLIFDH